MHQIVVKPYATRRLGHRDADTNIADRGASALPLLRDPGAWDFPLSWFRFVTFEVVACAGMVYEGQCLSFAERKQLWHEVHVLRSYVRSG